MTYRRGIAWSGVALGPVGRFAGNHRNGRSVLAAAYVRVSSRRHIWNHREVRPRSGTRACGDYEETRLCRAAPALMLRRYSARALADRLPDHRVTDLCSCRQRLAARVVSASLVLLAVAAASAGIHASVVGAASARPMRAMRTAASIRAASATEAPAAAGASVTGKLTNRVRRPVAVRHSAAAPMAAAMLSPSVRRPAIHRPCACSRRCPRWLAIAVAAHSGPTSGPVASRVSAMRREWRAASSGRRAARELGWLAELAGGRSCGCRRRESCAGVFLGGRQQPVADLDQDRFPLAMGAAEPAVDRGDVAIDRVGRVGHAVDGLAAPPSSSAETTVENSSQPARSSASARRPAAVSA